MAPSLFYSVQDTKIFTARPPTISLLIFIAIAAYLTQYLLLWTNFLYPYVDADQLVVADMASFYAKGVVPEPYFWGQPYMFPIESWLAVPLLAIGLRADLATMAVACCTFYIPFIYAIYLLRDKPIAVKAAVLATPLFLPPSFLLTALMPRNFGTTAALTALFILILLNNKKIAKIISSFFIGILAASYPPSAIVAPLALIGDAKAKQLYLLTGVAFFGFLVIFIPGVFYYSHPEHVVYPAPSLNLSIEQLWKSLTDSIHPLFILSLAMSPTLILVIYEIAKMRVISYSLALGLAILSAIVIIMMAATKLNDYTESVFFSAYRFWVAIPFVLLVIGTQLSIKNTSTAKQFTGDTPPLGIAAHTTRAPLYLHISLLLFIAIPLVFLSSWLNTNGTVELKKYSPTGVVAREDVVLGCFSLKNNLDPQATFVRLPGYPFWLGYGCHPLVNLIVLMEGKDRRTWLARYLETLK